MTDKRRLPVLAGPADAEPVPPLQRVVAATALAFVLWLPLVLLALYAARAAARGALQSEVTDASRHVAMFAPAALLLASLVLSTSIAGFAVRRGLRGAVLADALVGGALAAASIWGIALLAGSLAPWPLALASGGALLLAGLAGGALGGTLGRPPSSPGPRVDRGPGPH